MTQLAQQSEARGTAIMIIWFGVAALLLGGAALIAALMAPSLTVAHGVCAAFPFRQQLSDLTSERSVALLILRGFDYLAEDADQGLLDATVLALATSTDLSIRKIQARITGRASRTVVGEITKRVRFAAPAAL